MKYISIGFIAFVFSCSAQIGGTYEYPRIQKQSVVENHHGIEVEDDYRNIENLKDTLVREWFKNQGLFTNSILDTLNQVAFFKSEIKKNRWQNQNLGQKIEAR